MKSQQTILTVNECIKAVDDGLALNNGNIYVQFDMVICPGDLENPLVYNGVVIGLASYPDTLTCQSVEGKYPNIFTDVSRYVSSEAKKQTKLNLHFEALKYKQNPFQIDWIETNTGIDYQLNLFLA